MYLWWWTVPFVASLLILAQVYLSLYSLRGRAQALMCMSGAGSVLYWLHN